MEKLNFFRADVKFKVNDKPIKFQVVHNLSSTQGLSFDSAFECWIMRTNIYTAKSLCDYIMKKESGYVCMPISQWKRLNS